jgi:hypothetical protein
VSPDPRPGDEQCHPEQSVDELVPRVQGEAQEDQRRPEHPPSAAPQVEGPDRRQQHEREEADEGLLDVPTHAGEVLGRDQQQGPAEQ